MSAKKATFKSDGVEYAVTFKIGQQKAFQRETGEPVVAALASMETSPGDMVRLSALFRHALNPALGEDATDAVMDAIGIARTLELITIAAQEAFKGLMDPQTEPPAK